MPRLQDKIALVTGAARGIGEAIARAFAGEGAFVFVTDIEDEAGRALANSLQPCAKYFHLDVREETHWAEVIGRVLQQHGRLDVLVNNAGITGFENGSGQHDPERASLEDWRAVLATNLDGTFLGCRQGIRAMRRQGTGSIINLSSRSGLVGIPGAAAYAASKAAVRNHTKSVALYCAEQGWKIRCNSIHPAAVLTPMWESVLGNGEERAQRVRDVEAGVPLGRFGRPEEIAALAVLLASDEVPYMTGAELNVDGGILAGAAAPPPRR
jgi:NAD(P)-dependent dehydrogenase (short-subunit alcohol dehydrogenase family)